MGRLGRRPASLEFSTSVLSRLVSAVERPQFDKLLSVEAFYDAWMLVCAEHNPRVVVETVVRARVSA